MKRMASSRFILTTGLDMSTKSSSVASITNPSRSRCGTTSFGWSWNHKIFFFGWKCFLGKLLGGITKKRTQVAWNNASVATKVTINRTVCSLGTNDPPETIKGFICPEWKMVPPPIFISELMPHYFSIQCTSADEERLERCCDHLCSGKHIFSCKAETRSL